MKTTFGFFCLRPLRRRCKIQCAHRFLDRSGDVFICRRSSDAAVRTSAQRRPPQPPGKRSTRAPLAAQAPQSFRNHAISVVAYAVRHLSSIWSRQRQDLRPTQTVAFKRYYGKLSISRALEHWGHNPFQRRPPCAQLTGDFYLQAASKRRQKPTNDCRIKEIIHAPPSEHWQSRTRHKCKNDPYYEQIGLLPRKPDRIEGRHGGTKIPSGPPRLSSAFPPAWLFA